MIVVTGSVTARQDSFDEVRKLSLEHVHRSRGEPGCISHAVHVDCENPLRLVFFEQWADRAALLNHFAVPPRAISSNRCNRWRPPPPQSNCMRLPGWRNCRRMAVLPCEIHIAMQHKGT
jgi:quinol monooxygenase YgiN